MRWLMLLSACGSRSPLETQLDPPTPPASFVCEPGEPPAVIFTAASPDSLIDGLRVVAGRLYINSNDSAPQLISISPRGDARVVLVDVPEEIAFRADGRKVWIASSAGPTHIWSVDVLGGHRLQLLDVPAPINDVAIGTDHVFGMQNGGGPGALESWSLIDGSHRVLADFAGRSHCGLAVTDRFVHVTTAIESDRVLADARFDLRTSALVDILPFGGATCGFLPLTSTTLIAGDERDTRWLVRDDTNVALEVTRTGWSAPILALEGEWFYGSKTGRDLWRFRIDDPSGEWIADLEWMGPVAVDRTCAYVVQHRLGEPNYVVRVALPR